MTSRSASTCRSPLAADPPVVLGSAVNAYGLVRSLGEVGIRSVVADWRWGPACYSKYVRGRWRIPPADYAEEAVGALLRHAAHFPARPLLVPTSEAWVVAILNHRQGLERRFLLPMGESSVIRLTLLKTRMHAWCMEHGVPVPHSTSFEPGDDWRAFIQGVEGHLPVIVKPKTKGVGDEALGFMYMRFDTMKALKEWAESQGETGPSCGVLSQAFIPGPVSNLLSYQGYRSRDGWTYMGGFTKIRQTAPAHGCATAAFMAADEVSKRLALEILEKLGFKGFFDVEFKRDERDGKLHFIELNPRPGMLNYVATLQRINIAWIALADSAGCPLPEPEMVTGIPGVWGHFTRDFMHNVVRHRTCGVTEWARALKGQRLVDAYFNRDDPLVFVAGLVGTLSLFGKDLLRRVLGRMGVLKPSIRTTGQATA